MEIPFKAKPFHYLLNVMNEYRCQEETGEVIVPDSFPDIAEILNADPQMFLRGKECRNGALLISGSIRGSILYIPDDHSSPRLLELHIPYTMKIENEALREQSQVIIVPEIRSVDGRMVNSRKAMLRVNVGCSVHVYNEENEEIFELTEDPDYIEVLNRSYAVRVPLETSEKAFMIGDSLSLPLSDQNLEQVHKLICTLEICEKKLIANKAVFKGKATCVAIYPSADGTLCRATCSIPFSQYCELVHDYEFEKVELYPVLTGCESKFSSENGTRSMELSINVLVQCVVTGEKQIDVLEDAYAIAGDLQPEWHEYQFKCWLDEQGSVQPYHIHLSTKIKEVLDQRIYIDKPQILTGNDTKIITLPVHCVVLGHDADGQVCSEAGREEVRWELPLNEASECIVSSVKQSDSYSLLQTDGLNIRGDLDVSIICYGHQKLKTICGGSIVHDQDLSKDRPSVVLKKEMNGTSLWDIGKMYGSRITAIRSANQLDSDYLEQDQYILIPVG